MPALITEHASTVNFVLINIILALSIYLTLTTGLLSVANAGFMAIGAYTAAILATQASGPLGLGVAAGMLLAGAVALPLGLLVLRLRDVYLAIATLGFGEIVRIIALNGDKVLGALSGRLVEVFGGAEGITLAYHAPPLVLGLPLTSWPLAVGAAAATYLVLTLQGSRHGRALAAIRLDDAAAAALGIDVLRYKLLAFVLGAMLAAAAGALSTPVVRVIDPRNYIFTRAVDILAFAVLGGTTHWLGPLVGAALLTTLPEALRFLQEQREIVNGLIIVLAIIFLPRGLADPRVWGRLLPRAPLSPLHEGRPLAGSTRLAPWRADAFAPTAGPLLKLEGVSRHFGGLAALDEVSFEVPRQSIIGLIGPNGAGKTTLLNLVSGLDRPSAGAIYVAGQRVEGHAPHRVARLGVGRTFQNIRLFPELTVLENVMVGCHRRLRAGLLESLLRLPRARHDERAGRDAALRALALLRVAHLAALPAGTLSYGDQRRVELARALAAEPGLLLLDEPAAGLNSAETAQLGDLLLELRAAGLTMLVIEHDMELIMRVCDRVVVLNFGRTIAEGTPEQVRANPQVVEAYLGADVA